MTDVPRATRGTARGCCSCLRDARPGQRTCLACHAAAMHESRERLKAKRRAEAWQLAEVRRALRRALDGLDA